MLLATTSWSLLCGLLVDRVGTAARGASPGRGSATGTTVASAVASPAIAVVTSARVLTVLIALALRTVGACAIVIVTAAVGVVKERKEPPAAVLFSEGRRGSRQSKTKCRCHHQAIQLHVVSPLKNDHSNGWVIGQYNFGCNRLGDGVGVNLRGSEAQIWRLGC